MPRDTKERLGMKRLKIVCLLLFMLLLPLSLSAATWIDALNRQVELPEAPKRIISLVPSVTELLFALGLDEQIVGVTSFCTYPKQALDKPKVGGYADPSLEAITLLQPDLIFISADSSNPALLKKMERLKLPVYVVYPRGITETIDMIRGVGQVTGLPQEGDRLARQLENSLTQVRTVVAGRSRPRVLFCVMVQPLTVAGPETMVGDLIAAAGGDNVVPAGLNRYPTWNSEALLLADPDIIIVSPHPGTPNPADLFSNWNKLKAVKNQHIISVNPDWVHRPGPRLPFGLKALVEAFHGSTIN